MNTTYPTLADALASYEEHAAGKRKTAQKWQADLALPVWPYRGTTKREARRLLTDALATARTLEQVVRELRASGFVTDNPARQAAALMVARTLLEEADQ